jgi:tRNA-2-methylthio-N6-dimethylallyladenosine synthase
MSVTIDLPVLEKEQEPEVHVLDMHSGEPVQPLRRVYIETYGCQMNVADSEIVMGVLGENGYTNTPDITEADVVLLNTCSIREKAEEKIYHRLNNIKPYKRKNKALVVGVLGCMAERLRTDLLDTKKSIVDLVCGPDEYRKVPELIESAIHGSRGIAVKLSRVETYDDILPLRTEGISAWLSVMRGCDKFCTFCVVPFTRGRERSRTLGSVVNEVRQLVDKGFKEVTLLGQNVNSYNDNGNDFADLLAAVAQVDPALRVRYTTSHPQDMSDKLIETMAAHENLCKYIHLPVQSGSDRILQHMNRTYTREHYLKLVEKIRRVLPGVAFTTDIISGFCTETEEDHAATLSLLQEVRYDGAYMFKYSPREGTKAFEFGDDVPEEVKTRRLNEIIKLQQGISRELNDPFVGTTETVLIEGPSKKTDAEWFGRTDTNKVVIFTPDNVKSGDIRRVAIKSVTSATLYGELVKN